MVTRIGRTEGGIRMFSAEDLDWIRLIGHLKLSGMTLSEIREFTSLYQQGDKTIEERRALVHRRRDAIERQMAELQDTLDFITYKCWYYNTAAEMAAMLTHVAFYAGWPNAWAAFRVAVRVYADDPLGLEEPETHGGVFGLQ